MKHDTLPLIIEGITKRYKGNGRKLGYPTANIDSAIDASDGIYFGFADLIDYMHHPSLIFIGTPTTVGDTERRIEVYLFDIPDKDYYEQPIHIKIEHFYRPNITFDSIDALKEAMIQDEKAARAWFGN